MIIVAAKDSNHSPEGFVLTKHGIVASGNERSDEPERLLYMSGSFGSLYIDSR